MSSSSESPTYKDGYSTPAWDGPMTPPSTEASSPFPDWSRHSPQPKDMMYVTQRLWSGPKHHTPRFSFENPTWPEEEGYPEETSSLWSSVQGDDVTIADNSTGTQSRCSQVTLCGSLTSGKEDGWISKRGRLTDYGPFGLSQSSYDKTLPPTPSYEYEARFDHSSQRQKQCRLEEVLTSWPLSEKKTPSGLRNISPAIPLSTGGDRVHSWPAFAAQREAPKPPVTESSAWSDSETEAEGAEKDQVARFRRKISNPLRAILCRGKGPRRKSA